MAEYLMFGVVMTLTIILVATLIAITYDED